MGFFLLSFVVGGAGVVVALDCPGWGNGGRAVGTNHVIVYPWFFLLLSGRMC